MLSKYTVSQTALAYLSAVCKTLNIYNFIVSHILLGRNEPEEFRNEERTWMWPIRKRKPRYQTIQ